MAIMIPSVISPEVKSTAERRIFEWFQSAPDTDDWIVLHSLGITTHNRVIYGETDFFVLAPGLGLFALEVKGGRVRRENGIWYFKNKYDCEDHRARGPFDQAKDCAFSIIGALKTRLDGTYQHLKSVFFGYGVMFPDIEYVADGVDEAQWQVFDSLDAKNVKSYIQRLAQGSKNLWENVYGPLPSEKLPQKDDVKYLAAILRGDFDCALSVCAQFRNADDAIIKLTKEQYRCLDQLDDNPRCLIQGPAGSGKTLLALEEVKKSAARGEKVALFCFNSNLADWLSYHFKNLPIDICPQFVGTFHSFMQQITREAGYMPTYPSDSSEVQRYYQETLPKAAVKALHQTEFYFDKIVVDEAQDLIRDHYLNVWDGCLLKGLQRGCWTLFGDFSMQAIYAGNVSGPEMIEKLDDIAAFIRFKLTLNCRNTKPICKEIQTITGFKVPNDLWTRVDGPPVQYITWSSMEDQCIKLKAILRHLDDAHIDAEKITILSPRKRENSVVSMISGYAIKDFQVPQGMDISFCTIQAYKGLENTVIILADIEGYDSRQLMYVGLSRASSGLFILESEGAKREHDSLLIRRLLQ